MNMNEKLTNSDPRLQPYRTCGIIKLYSQVFVPDMGDIPYMSYVWFKGIIKPLLSYFMFAVSSRKDKSPRDK